MPTPTQTSPHRVSSPGRDKSRSQGSSEAAQSTRERILDAADRLFGQLGFRGTSLRALTAEAGVNLAAVNYHFGSKQELLRATISRHLQPINVARLAELDRLEAESADGRVPVERILEALCRPALEFTNTSSQSATVVQRVAALIHAEPIEMLAPLVEELFGEINRRFTAALTRALPELPAEDVALRFQLCIGAMVHVIAGRGAPLVDLPRGARVEQMVPFLAAGFRASGTDGEGP